MFLIVLPASSYLSFRLLSDFGTKTQRPASWKATPATLKAETGSIGQMVTGHAGVCQERVECEIVDGEEKVQPCSSLMSGGAG